MIEFFVPGKPQGKGRPRFGRGFTYTPAKTVEYEKTIRAAFKVDGWIRSGHFSLSVRAVFEVPKSWPKLKKAHAHLGIIRPGKTDLDNIAKAVMDGLNGYAWDDDSQVVSLEASKEYGDINGLYVTIKII